MDIDWTALGVASTVILILILILLGAIATLFARWNMRIEARVDTVEDRQWEMLKSLASKEDLREMRSHIDDRLDRLETRAASGGTARAAE